MTDIQTALFALRDPAYQQQIGQAIADGLEAYEVLLARTRQEDAA